MRTLKFYGHSDDCFEIDGTRGDEPDEIGAFHKTVVVYLKSAISEQRVAVVGTYAPNGKCTWAFGIALIDDGDDLPPWPIKFTREHDYSVALTIECPDDTSVSIP